MGRFLIVACVLMTLPVCALAETFEVQVANFSFTPSELTVQPGDTVRWVWVDGIHTTTSGSPDDSETAGDVWEGDVTSTNTMFEFTFNDVGVFPYFCAVHPTLMQATVTVETGVPVEPTTWSSIKRLFEDTSPGLRF